MWFWISLAAALGAMSSRAGAWTTHWTNPPVKVSPVTPRPGANAAEPGKTWTVRAPEGIKGEAAPLWLEVARGELRPSSASVRLGARVEIGAMSRKGRIIVYQLRKAPATALKGLNPSNALERYWISGTYLTP